MHCDDPPCVKVCPVTRPTRPTRASSRRSGIAASAAATARSPARTRAATSTGREPEWPESPRRTAQPRRRHAARRAWSRSAPSATTACAPRKEQARIDGRALARRRRAAPAGAARRPAPRRPSPSATSNDPHSEVARQPAARGRSGCSSISAPSPRSTTCARPARMSAEHAARSLASTSSAVGRSRAAGCSRPAALLLVIAWACASTRTSRRTGCRHRPAHASARAAPSWGSTSPSTSYFVGFSFAGISTRRAASPVRARGAEAAHAHRRAAHDRRRSLAGACVVIADLGRPLQGLLYLPAVRAARARRSSAPSRWSWPATCSRASSTSFSRGARTRRACAKRVPRFRWSYRAVGLAAIEGTDAERARPHTLELLALAVHPAAAGHRALDARVRLRHPGRAARLVQRAAGAQLRGPGGVLGIGDADHHRRGRCKLLGLDSGFRCRPSVCSGTCSGSSRSPISILMAMDAVHGELRRGCAEARVAHEIVFGAYAGMFWTTVACFGSLDAIRSCNSCARATHIGWRSSRGVLDQLRLDPEALPDHRAIADTRHAAALSRPGTTFRAQARSAGARAGGLRGVDLHGRREDLSDRSAGGRGARALRACRCARGGGREPHRARRDLLADARCRRHARRGRLPALAARGDVAVSGSRRALQSAAVRLRRDADVRLRPSPTRRCRRRAASRSSGNRALPWTSLHTPSAVAARSN